MFLAADIIFQNTINALVKRINVNKSKITANSALSVNH